MSFELAVQQAVFDALNGNLGGVAVYDDVPQSQADWKDSFVTIGEDVFTAENTDLTLLQRVSITVHTWTRYGGRKACKELQAQIFAQLNRVDLSQPGFNFINIYLLNSSSELDLDGHTRHGVQTFELLIEEL